MYQNIDENSILLSITNPDLSFKWRDVSPASPTVNIRLTLYGEWSLLSQNSDVKIIENTDDSITVMEFKLIDGLPVEVKVKLNSSQSVQLSPNNFEIFSTSQRCPNVNNGKISIKNLSSYKFNFVVTGPNLYDKTFSNKLANEPFVIENLSVGTYNITAKFYADGIGEDITGFQITINESALVSGINKSVNKLGKSSVFTVSGDKKYSIYVNDIFQRIETFSDESEYEITVENLSVGKNHIKIIPENICRGLIESWITIPNSNIKFYPNPAVDLFHNGRLVYNKNYKPVNGIVYFSMRDLSAGLYIIRVSGRKAGDNINFKITKK